MRLISAVMSITTDTMNKTYPALLVFLSFLQRAAILNCLRVVHFQEACDLLIKKEIYPSFPIASREQLLYHFRTVFEWQLSHSPN